MENLPLWLIVVILIVILILAVVLVGLVGYAVVVQGRQFDFWPPKLHPKHSGAPVSDQAEIQKLESQVQKYKSFLDYLPELGDTDIAILDELAGQDGPMDGHKLEITMEARNLDAGLGGTLTGMRDGMIIEGELNAQVTLTDFGRRLVRIRRAFQKALEALQAKDRRNKPSI